MIKFPKNQERKKEKGKKEAIIYRSNNYN